MTAPAATVGRRVDCQHDSGSATGFVPLCDDRATWTVTYRNGSSGPHILEVCDAHLGATRGRVHPGEVSTVRRESARVPDHLGWSVRHYGAAYPPGFLESRRAGTLEITHPTGVARGRV